MEFDILLLNNAFHLHSLASLAAFIAHGRAFLRKLHRHRWSKAKDGGAKVGQTVSQPINISAYRAFSHHQIFYSQVFGGLRVLTGLRAFPASGSSRALLSTLVTSPVGWS